ncbi:secreted RxLR effector protein 161-like [Rutidosis leptorrhynchoides]|uniref:secreted RxLR effector protein 161-like n=1 Tax=Rutidosis leptorrhynchoides TaxID=125765 RepID=UPI003A98D6E7
MATPMAPNIKLTLEGEGDSFDSTKYRRMIGSLLYLIVSRPDIMYSVCLCARFQENPKMSHVEAVKRIFRYSKGIMHLGLWYPKFTGVDRMCFADSDHGGSLIDQKSTSVVCAFVGLCLTSWFSMKQTSIALSATEAEYVAVGRACEQVLWMKHTFIDYNIISS